MKKIMPQIAIIIAVFNMMTVSISATTSNADVSKYEIYPNDVRITDDPTDASRRHIVKIYELSSGASPNVIPQSSFEQDGYLFTLTDIVQDSLSDVITKTGKKTITVETESKEIEEILKVLPQNYEFEKDGYTGTIPLDLSSIETESKGTEYGSYTVTATREYPNLSSNDTSLIPKTTTEKGVTVSLDDVQWQPGRTENIDSDHISETYTAIAKYSGTASYSYVKGYMVTARYKGEVSKLDTNKAIYEARFSGTKLAPSVENLAVDENGRANTKLQDNVAYIIIVAIVLAVIAGLCVVLIRQRGQIRLISKSIKDDEAHCINYEEMETQDEE